MDVSSLSTLIYSTWPVVPLFGLAVSIGMGVAAFIYLIGTMLMNDKLKAWGKSEFFEILYSGIVFSLTTTAVMMANGILTSLFTDGADPITAEICSSSFVPATMVDSPYYEVGSCHIRLAIYFLHSLFDEAVRLGRGIYYRYLWTSMLADLSITYEFVLEAAAFFTIHPLRGIFTMGNTISVLLFDWLTKLMIVTKFQEVFIVFIDRALFAYLLAVGLVLRVTAFTRRLGGLLMAIALVLFFVYPMFYSFGALLINSIKISATEAGGNAWQTSFIDKLYLEGSVPMLQGEFNMDGVAEIDDVKRKIESGELLKDTSADFDLSATSQPSDEEIKKAAEKSESWLGQVVTKKWYDNMIMIGYESGGPVDSVARIAFFSIFFGITAMIGSIAAIRSLSIILGGDIEIAGLTHLI